MTDDTIMRNRFNVGYLGALTWVMQEMERIVFADPDSLRNGRIAVLLGDSIIERMKMPPTYDEVKKDAEA